MDIDRVEHVVTCRGELDGQCGALEALARADIF